MSYTKKWSDEEHKIARETYRISKDSGFCDARISEKVQIVLAESGYKRSLDAINAWKYKHITLKRQFK